MDTDTDLRACGGADAYLRSCASRTVLDVIANKWTCLLIGALQGGSMRFGELRRRLDGITQKSLTQALRRLERDGLVTRTLHPTIPPRVDYELTELGMNVSELLKAITGWSEEHAAEITKARQAYDERTEPPTQVFASDALEPPQTKREMLH